MNNQNIINRIKKILTYYDISASKFADTIQVQRSSISHLLSGRNKPSLDFVMKIVNEYDEVSVNWLLLGEGDFPKITNKQEMDTPTPPNVNLFTQNFDTPKQKEEIPTAINEALATNPIRNTTDGKTIEQIVIFYTDGSFKNYK